MSTSVFPVADPLADHQFDRTCSLRHLQRRPRPIRLLSPSTFTSTNAVAFLRRRDIADSLRNRYSQAPPTAPSGCTILPRSPRRTTVSFRRTRPTGMRSSTSPSLPTMLASPASAGTSKCFCGTWPPRAR